MDLERLLADDNSLDQQLQDGLLLLERRVIVPSEAAAEAALEQVDARRGERYPRIGRSWRAN